MVKNARLDDAFLEVFWLQASPVEGTAAKRKEKEKKERGKKIQKSKSLNFDFCARPTQNVVKRGASGKKGKRPCCKCLFDQIKPNLADIQPENHQNVQKRIFGKKLQESMG